MKFFLLLVLASRAVAGGIVQGGLSAASSSLSPSTITITGTGSKCFSADDPTLVVDCGAHKVTVGGSAGLGVTYGVTAGSVTTSGVAGMSLVGASIQSTAGTLNTIVLNQNGAGNGLM